jgi:hypothetical protein
MAKQIEVVHYMTSTGTWRDIFRRHKPPSALQLAVSALEHCRRESLDYAHQAEEAAGMLKVCKDRETRLTKEIARLSKAEKQPLDQIGDIGAV